MTTSPRVSEKALRHVDARGRANAGSEALRDAAYSAPQVDNVLAIVDQALLIEPIHELAACEIEQCFIPERVESHCRVRRNFGGVVEDTPPPCDGIFPAGGLVVDSLFQDAVNAVPGIGLRRPKAHQGQCPAMLAGARWMCRLALGECGLQFGGGARSHDQAHQGERSGRGPSHCVVHRAMKRVTHRHRPCVSASERGWDDRRRPIRICRPPARAGN